jgi:hypothetical protein
MLDENLANRILKKAYGITAMCMYFRYCQLSKYYKQVISVMMGRLTFYRFDEFAVKANGTMLTNYNF